MKRTIGRLRAEYLEMPGLRLTVAQAQRLCGVEPTMCQAILDALVDAKVLYRESDGQYARLDGVFTHVDRARAAALCDSTVTSPIGGNQHASTVKSDECATSVVSQNRCASVVPHVL
jgi:hypothetical protein